MAVEDEVVGALKKSKQSRKSKKWREENKDIVADNPVHIANDMGVKGDENIEEEDQTKMKSDNVGVERKKKKNKSARDNKEGAHVENTNGITVEKSEKRKRKREVKSNGHKSNGLSDDTTCDVSVNDGGYVHSTANEINESNRKLEQKVGAILDGCIEGKTEIVKKKKKKKKKEKMEDAMGSVDVSTGVTCAEDIANFGVNKKQDGGVGNDNISLKQVKDSSKDPKPKNHKKVTFSSELEVFPESNVPESGEDQSEEVELVRGKRFSKEEDEIVKEAVYNYIEVHNLGEEGLNMVLNSKSRPEVKNCWKEIGAAIPYRPYTAVYYRAQLLFRRDENHKWTEEEKALILEHQKLHGNQWKELAEIIGGKHRFHVKDTYRRIRLPNRKKGHWSQDEYQNLFDLVNTDLQLKISEEKKSKHGMLRDNICWTAVSDKLSTRNGDTCCLKWYRQLTSPMVAEGIWSDADDYRLIGELYNLDETCVENVDWDNLLEHRCGEVCLKRWKQMVLHIGDHGNKPFSEQVEVLAKRYCPSLIEAREAWDSKPVVP